MVKFMTEVKKIEMPGSADITMVAVFHETLKEALNAGVPISFNAAAVTRADTAFLQLLTSFIIEASTRKISITWESMSEAFEQSIKLLGLSERFK